MVRLGWATNDTSMWRVNQLQYNNTRRMQGIVGASLSEHACCVSVLVIEVTMIVLMNNNHINTIEEKELGIMWVLADTDPACL